MSNTEPKGCLFAVLKVLGIAPNVGQENRAQSNVLPYRRKDYLLTKAERAFFDVLHPMIRAIFSGQDSLDIELPIWLK